MVEKAVLRGGGWVEPAMDPHENNKGQLGAIIQPNAPCLPSCLQWLSGEWQIECTHAKGYLGDQELLSGAGWGSGGGGGWAARCLSSARALGAAVAAFPLPLIQQSSARPCRLGSCIM